MRHDGSIRVFAGFLLVSILGCNEAPPPTVKPNAPPAGGSANGEQQTESGQGLARQAEPARPVIAPEDLPTPAEITAEDWPQFRGQHRDAVVRGTTRLARAWPEGGPPVLWETNVGQGYSSPAVVGDRVYLNDYDEAANEWMVRCLALADGKPLWTYTVDKRIRPNHGITRSAPATDGGYVFAIDPKCELYCLDARNGNVIWRKFLPKLYDTTIPPWYNGQCPLVEEDRVIVAIGGTKLMAAFDKATGQPIWETPNDEEFLMSHSSIMPVEFDGVKQYTYITLKGAIGVDAESGALLWHFPWKFNTAVPTTPLPVGDNKLLLTSGYHAQTVVCLVQREGSNWTASQAAAFAPPPQGWNSEVHTPIMLDGKIYGVGKVKRGQWTCLDDEGNELWNSGRKSFEMGGYVLADGMFYILDGRSGTLRLVDATADDYQQLSEAKILTGPDVWAPPVIVGGKLIVRDLARLVCLDISQQAVAAEPSDGDSTLQ